MRMEPAHLEHARRVADAILYEGYLLYPYRGSAQKNQVRFQFGVLMPPAYCVADPSETSAFQTECLLECADDAQVLVTVRFLQLQHRIVQEVPRDGGEPRDVASLEVDGTEYTSWQEAAERQQQASASVGALLGKDRNLEFHIGSGESSEDLNDAGGRQAGRLIRRWAGLDGRIQLSAARVAGPYGALRLRLRVENRADPEVPPGTRDEALGYAMIAAHALIGVPGGAFLSQTDPPEWAAAEVAACTNIGTWPVLAGDEGDRKLVLSAPIILYDHPRVAPESPGDLFDATEIDEILTLRTMTLTEEEKREARASDARAAAIIDRVDNMPPEMLDRLHGAIRYLRTATTKHDSDTSAAPWWDPGADASVSPETDQVEVAGARVSKGSLVRLRPGLRRADAQDMFLAGKTARVEGVFFDVEDKQYLAVTLADDPAAEIYQWHGRFLYFYPDEVEPLEIAP